MQDSETASSAGENKKCKTEPLLSASPPISSSSTTNFISSSDVICLDDSDSADDDVLAGLDASFLLPPCTDVALVECPACPTKVPEHELNKHLDTCLSL